MLSPFIEDGYEFDGQVPAVANLYDAIPFRYRPALADEVISYHRGQGRGTPKQEAQHTADFLKRHLTAWTLTRPTRSGADEAVPLNVEWLLRLPYAVLLSMANHVCGYTAPQAQVEADNAKN